MGFWLSTIWILLFAALCVFVLWVSCIHLSRSMRPAAQPVDVRIRQMLLEGFSVWRISDELAVSANQVHEVMEQIVREKKG